MSVISPGVRIGLSGRSRGSLPGQDGTCTPIFWMFLSLKPMTQKKLVPGPTGAVPQWTTGHIRPEPRSDGTSSTAAEGQLRNSPSWTRYQDSRSLLAGHEDWFIDLVIATKSRAAAPCSCTERRHDSTERRSTIHYRNSGAAHNAGKIQARSQDATIWFRFAGANQFCRRFVPIRYRYE